MNTTSKVLIIGEIDGEPVRKTVKEKPLTEFAVKEIGLRISAWEARAAQVPASGIVIVEGYLSTRHYQYEGADRTSVEIRATSVQAIDGAPAPKIDNELPF